MELSRSFVCYAVLLLAVTTGLPGHAQQNESTSAEQTWTGLVEGNQRFVSGKSQRPDVTQLRRLLVNGQHPKAIVLACSDSRVPPEVLFDQSLGDLFVIRAAGNVAGDVGIGSIEYAFTHLGSSLLVVLGHEKCTAVADACSAEKMPTPGLQALVDKIEPAVVQAKNYAKPADLLDSAIEENIHLSAEGVLAGSAVLREGLRDGKLTVIEAIYKLDTGEVVRLGKLEVLTPVYKLDVGDIVRGK